MRLVSMLGGSVLLFLFVSGPWFATAIADQLNRERAEQLLQQAEKLTDIRSSDSHSFRMAAHVTIYGSKDLTSEGTYNLSWKSPTSWRDETTFADFSQVRVADVDKLFVYRNPPNLLPEVFRLLTLLDFPNLLRATPEARAQYLKERTSKGLVERIIGIDVPGGFGKIVDYLSSSSAVPTRVEHADLDFGYTFGDYMEFNGHQFPHTLTMYRSDQTKIKVRVEELAEAKFEPSVLIPPPNAQSVSWCAHPQRARPTGLFELNSFNRPTRGLRASPVAIYGIIGGDGKWHDLAVVRAAGNVTDSSTFWMNQLLQERFIPAKCGDNPVQQEAVIEFLPH
jgi:hypothetical protein